MTLIQYLIETFWWGPFCREWVLLLLLLLVPFAPLISVLLFLLLKLTCNGVFCCCTLTFPGVEVHDTSSTAATDHIALYMALFLLAGILHTGLQSSKGAQRVQNSVFIDVCHVYFKVCAVYWILPCCIDLILGHHPCCIKSSLLSYIWISATLHSYMMSNEADMSEKLSSISSVLLLLFFCVMLL